MLGAVQVQLELESGLRLGYSGDFSWPLEDVIQVDALVVDSTYGSPANRREYSQGDVEASFLDLTRELLQHSPVHILANRGTLSRALQVLTGNVDAPIIGSDRLCAEADIYRQFGYSIVDILHLGSPHAKDAMTTARYIRVYSKGDRRPVDGGKGATLTLSAYMSRSDVPITPYSERAFGVALSNQADFDGTLAYVEATGARFVVTDNMRGHGVELAMAIVERLDIEAVPSMSSPSREWG